MDALAASRDALDLSQRLGHQPSISHTHLFRAELFTMLDRPDDAAAHLRASIALAERYSLAAYLNAGDLKQGFVRVVLGDVAAGLHQAESALELLRSVPSRRFHLPIRIGIVARARAAAGDTMGALALFDSALDAAATTGERWYEPELLRFKAELLLGADGPAGAHGAAAERCPEGALGLAREQEARLWELRVARVLAGLRGREGRPDEARALLAPVCAWFGDGLELADVRAARALLEDLGR